METLRADAFGVSHERGAVPFGVLVLCFEARYASMRAARGARIIRLAVTAAQWLAIRAALDEGFGPALEKKFLGKGHAIVELVRELKSGAVCTFRDTVHIQSEAFELAVTQLDAFLNQHVSELAGEWRETGRGNRDRS